MKFETLQYPHPKLRQADQAALPILDATYELVKAGADAARAQGVSHDIHIAKSVQHVVNKSLRWSESAQPIRYSDGGYTPEIQHNQVTNCLGYTLLTSELLSEFEVPNLTAHMGGHFMNLVPHTTGDTTGLYLIDGFAPQLSQDIGAAVADASVERLMADVYDPSVGQGVMRVDTARFIWQLNKDPDTLTEGGAYPWLFYEKGKTTVLGSGRSFMHDDRQYRNRYTKFMTVYSQEIAPKILAAYGVFLEAAAEPTMPVETALDAVQALQGHFPEIDARAEHKEAKQFISKLVAKDMVVEALDVIGSYCSSFTFSQDPRLKGLEAGLYYDIASKTDDLAFRGLAMQAYTEAEARAQHSSQTYTGRIDTLSKAIAVQPAEF